MQWFIFVKNSSTLPKVFGFTAISNSIEEAKAQLAIGNIVFTLPDFKQIKAINSLHSLEYKDQHDYITDT